MKLVEPQTVKVAIIGMPRSGSTIVASYINSIDNALIIGEPHLAACRPVPDAIYEGFTIMDTQYGAFTIDPTRNIIAQLDTFAAEVPLQIYGIKECWTPVTDAIEIAEEFNPDITLVTIREPRKNYMSLRIAAQMNNNYIPTPDEFNDQYTRLIEYTTKRSNISPVFLDFFRINPEQELIDATVWELDEDHKFGKYAGGGDGKARASTSVKLVDTQKPYAKSDILASVRAYENAISPLLCHKIYMGESFLT